MAAIAAEPSTAFGPLMAPTSPAGWSARSRASRGRPSIVSVEHHPERLVAVGSRVAVDLRLPRPRAVRQARERVAQHPLGVADERAHLGQHELARRTSPRAPAAAARPAATRRPGPAGRRTPSPACGRCAAARGSGRGRARRAAPSLIGGMISPSPCELRALGSKVPGHAARRCPSSARCSGRRR